jgi:hypothetical protein
MSNATTFYAVIGIGIIGIIVGIYLYSTGQHAHLGPAVIIAGAILVVAGVVGMFVVRRR